MLLLFGVKMKYKCIYCLQEKDETDFNREHVIPQLMGTYKGGMVLSDNQVCCDCNSFFSKTIENELALDSFEGFLRYFKKTKTPHKKRKIGKTRIKTIGAESVLSGVEMDINSNPNGPENVQLVPHSCIGIIRDIQKKEYDYYTIKTLPDCTEEVLQRMAHCGYPIIFQGYSKKEVEDVLTQRHYCLPNAKYKDDISISTLIGKDDITIHQIVSLSHEEFRLAAKTVFNYMCYAYGKEYVLENTFDQFRRFIRYGDPYMPAGKFMYGKIISIPELSEDSHIVGLAWTITDKLCLCGFISWYNEITFSFIIKQYPTSTGCLLLPLKYSICDNTNRVVTIKEDTIIFPWLQNSKDNKT